MTSSTGCAQVALWRRGSFVGLMLARRFGFGGKP
jgi:hypothetical protein